jgi:hypothetical protein
VFGDDPRDFQTIEVLGAHLAENAIHRFTKFLRAEHAKRQHLHFRCEKKEMPSGGANFVVNGEAIERLGRCSNSRSRAGRLNQTAAAIPKSELCRLELLVT